MTRRTKRDETSEDWKLFEAEAMYGQSVFRDALGDSEAAIAAAERALEIKPDYQPAILTMGSIDYQRGREAEGKRLFLSLLSLPDDSGELDEIIDKAGDFLIQTKRYADGLELYRRAIERFPDSAELYRGFSCCAGHEGLYDEALDASEKALALEPERQESMSDLGWCLFEAGRLEEAREALLKAVSMDPDDTLSRGNLRLCEEKLSKKR